MANTTRTNAELGIKVTTAGVDAIRELESEVRKLAKGGSEAAPEFSALADELARIGDASGALEAFKEASQEVERLSLAESEARQNTERLRAELSEAAAATNKFAAEQSAARQALRDSRDALAQKKTEITTLRNETDKAGRSEDAFKVQVQELQREIIRGRDIVRERTTALSDATAKVNQAGDAEDALSAKVTRASRELERTAKTLRERNTALDESKVALGNLDGSTEALAAAEAKLSNELRDSRAQLDALVLARDRAANATRLQAEADEALAFAARANAAEYANFWLEALRARDAEEERTAQRIREDAAAQAISVKADAAEYVNFWREALRERDAEEARVAQSVREQNQTVAAETKANADEYVRFWQQALRERDALEKQTAAEIIESANRAEIDAKANAASYVNFWTNALQEREARERALLDAQRSIDQAFAAVGVRSAGAVREEINRVNQALRQLATNGNLTGAEFDRAFATGQRKIADLNRELSGTSVLARATGSAINFATGAVGQLAAAFGLIEAGTKFIQVNNQIETLRRSLTLITGSTGAAAEKIRFLQETASNAGQSVGSVSDAYIKFTASATAAGIASTQVDAIFKSLVNAGGQLGLSSEKSTLALEALSQIAGKGTVSLEELRGQLGDSLPGALAIAAKGLDLTQAQLIKLVESGRLTAEEFFPAFRRGLEQTFGDPNNRVDGLRASFNRLANEITKVAQRATDSTAFKLLGSTFDFLAANIEGVVTALFGLGKAFTALAILDAVKRFGQFATATTVAAVETTKQTATVIANTAAVTANTAATAANNAVKNSAAFQAIATALGGQNKAIDAGTTAVSLQTRAVQGLGAAFGAVRGLGAAALGAIGGLPGLLAIVAVNAKDIGTAIGESAARFVGYGKTLEENERQLDALSKREQQAREERERLNLETQIAEKRTLGLNNASGQLFEEFNKVEGKTLNVSDALKKLSDDLQLGDITGITNAATALDALGRTGKLTSDQISVGLSGALERLNIDLGVFTTNARSAFDGSEDGARRLQLLLDGAVAESIRRTGLDAKLISSGISEASQIAVNNLSVLADNLTTLAKKGVDTGLVLKKSLSDALAAADSEKAVEAVVVQIERLRTTLGTKLAENFLDDARVRLNEIKDAADAATPGINSVREAYLRLGQTAPEDLERVARSARESFTLIASDGKASTEAIRQGFETYSAAAIKGNKDSVAATQETIKVLESLRLKLGDRVTDGFIENANAALEKLKQAAEDETPKIDSLAEGFRKLGVTSDAELTKIADKNKTAYDFIASSGSASLGTLQQAFVKYAESAIAASGGVGTETNLVTRATIEQEGRVRGLVVTYDELGKISVKTQQQAAAETNKTNKALRDQKGALDEVSAGLSEQERQQELVNKVTKRRNEILQETIDLENKRRGVDREGFSTDKNGNRLVAGSDLGTRTGILNFLKSAGVDEENARRITGEFSDAKGDIPFFSNPGQIKYGGRNSTISQALLKAAETVTFRNASAIDPLAVNRGGTPAAGGTRTININLNGNNTPINVASDADARALEGIISQLAQARARTA